ncbi:PilZ domain-containing protein [Altererythrobacter sp. KTW20L]|uniref:PilZ domain-containing protein n=1 Tax=Altererythrobacter sp. KTW20L TaxID=2942210 RepID=UPI0020BF00F3|nr:PilZ domain-containing protein [Altererythrobacter sp. KTW20L]MCL6250229.1 PilZ domain-containing protein [Altererythrobacter sp. KTW20L]
MRDALHAAALSPLAGTGAEPGTDHYADQRTSPRFTMLVRAAKLRCPAGEFMCVVRDASDTGVSVRLFHPLPDEERLMLELQNGDCHELELVWVDRDRAGLKFLAPANIARIVECPSRFAKRPIRINLNAAAQLVGGLASAVVEIHDISQQGAKITSTTRFAIDQRVRLSAEGLPEVNAKVRWRRGETYGLVFEDTFQFGDMARIVATLQLGKNAAFPV